MAVNEFNMLDVLSADKALRSEWREAYVTGVNTRKSDVAIAQVARTELASCAVFERHPK